MRRVRNRNGNPDIVKYGEEWRQKTPNWREILIHISQARSTGPRTEIGKFISSLNAHTYELGHPKSRISPNSMMGQLLSLYSKDIEKIKRKKII